MELRKVNLATGWCIKSRAVRDFVPHLVGSLGGRNEGRSRGRREERRDTEIYFLK